MKAKKWINGNKMLFKSEHKTFNKYINCISTGNVIGRGQLSSYVRPYNETKCNGFVNEKGHLQEYDLNWILKDLPCYVKDYIREVAKNKPVIAYHFFYYKNDKKYDIGYVITTDEKKLLRSYVSSNGTYKAYNALSEAIKYIIN